MNAHDRPGRLWIVNHYAGAPDQPAGTRHVDLGRELTRRGWDVTIFAVGFSNLTQHETRVRGSRLAAVGRVDGVRFVWLRTPPYSGNTWRRMVNMAAFAVLFPVVQAVRDRPDIVVGSTVHPFAALSAWLVARLRRARFVFEIRDLWPQTLVDLGAMRTGTPPERLLRAIEAHLVRRSDSVVTLLAGVPAYLAAHGLPSDHVTHVPNGVDVAAFDAASRRPVGTLAEQPMAAIADLATEGRCVFGYLGAFGRVNQLETIVRAAAIAERRRPRSVGLVLVGDGAEADMLRRLVDLTGAPVRIADAIPKAAVPCVLSAIDVGVVHAVATATYRYGTSFNKVHEYLAAGRPVLFACSAPDDPVRESGAGISVAPDDPVTIAEAMLDLASRTSGERERMGAAGRRWTIAERDTSGLADRFEHALTGAAA